MKKGIFRDNIRTLFRPPVVSWALYDLANTSFAVVIITVIFPVYFTSIIASPEIYSRNFGDLMWGIASGTSMIIASLLSPVFGAIADNSRSKNKFLTILTLACVSFSSLLFFLKEGMIAWAMILFIVSNIFYETSMMFYISFLPQLSSKNNTGIVSGFGFSVGYLGGLIILILVYPFVAGGNQPSHFFKI